LALWSRKGSSGLSALELDVVKLMAKHTAALLEGLVGMIRGPPNPKSEGARRKVHSQPQPSKVRAETGAQGR
jgi:hypothetical protein